MERPHIDRTHMQLAGLAFTASDNPFHLSKESIVNGISEYLDTNTIITFADQPEKLAALQARKWSPAIEWANKQYQLDIAPTTIISEGPHITDESPARLESYLLEWSNLFGLWLDCNMPLNLWSVLLTLATTSHSIEAPYAAELARLEQIFQTQIWGNVELTSRFRMVQLKRL